MKELEQTLRFLSDVVPAIPERLASVAGNARSLEGLFRHLVEHAEIRRAAADELTTKAKAALAGLETEAGGSEGRVEAGMTTLEATLQLSLTSVAEEHGTLRREMNEAASAMLALKGDLTAGASRLGSASEDASGAVGELAAAVRAGETALREAHEWAMVEVLALQQVVRETAGELQGEVDSYRARLQTLVGQVTARLAQAGQNMRALDMEHSADLTEAASALDSGRDALRDDLGRLIETGLKEPLHLLGRDVVATMRDMNTSLGEFKAEVAGTRPELLALVAPLAELTDTLRRGADNVKEVAARVSVEWSVR